MRAADRIGLEPSRAAGSQSAHLYDEAGGAVRPGQSQSGPAPATTPRYPNGYIREEMAVDSHRNFPRDWGNVLGILGCFPPAPNDQCREQRETGPNPGDSYGALGSHLERSKFGLGSSSTGTGKLTSVPYTPPLRYVPIGYTVLTVLP